MLSSLNLPTKSIAILPFVDMSKGQENEFFGDGISEEIINALTKVSGLSVTARTSSFAFKNRNMDIREIGKQLGVSTILEGSIRIAKQGVRITAQLINVTDGFHFWSETFDRSFEDIFKVQEEISLILADKLRENLGHFHIEAPLNEFPNVSTATYSQFLRGRYHIQKFNAENINTGLQVLLEVIKEAPDFTLPYLSIYEGYSFLGNIGLMPSNVAFSKAKGYLDKAIELEESLPECQYQLANIAFWQEWDLDSTYRYLSKAIELRPAYAEAYTFLSVTMATEQKFDAATTYIETALQLDPFSANNHHWRGCIYYVQEKYAAALPYFEKSLALAPQFVFSQIFLGAALLKLGRLEEGLKKYEQLPANSGADLSRLGGCTLAYAFMGDQKKTASGIKKLRDHLQTDIKERALFFLILIEVTTGNIDEAIDLIRRGVEHRLPMMLMLNIEPLLNPIRSHTVFQTSMHQILGKYEATRLVKKKYAKSSLKQEQANAYRKLLQQVMTSEKPYLDPALSLRQLAKIIDMHPNQLSQLLNEQVKQNFSEFINSYRLEDFKEKAKDPSFHYMTLLALALDCGFSSKTVFNTFFKKKMGITPREYWKQVTE